MPHTAKDILVRDIETALALIERSKTLLYSAKVELLKDQEGFSSPAPQGAKRLKLQASIVADMRKNAMRKRL